MYWHIVMVAYPCQTGSGDGPVGYVWHLVMEQRHEEDDQDPAQEIAGGQAIL